MKKLGIILITLCLLFMTAQAADVSNIALPTELITIGVGQVVELEPTLTPSTESKSSLKWKSSDEDVATIFGDTIVGQSTGYAIVSVTASGGASAYVGVKVLGKGGQGVTGITISNSTLKVYKGYTKKLTVSLSPKNAADRTGKWISANKEVATVSSAGVVKGVEYGTTRVTAVASSGITASCDVTVVEVPVKSISLSKKAITLSIGQKATLKKKIAPEDAYDSAVQWKSADTNVVTVDENGNIEAVGGGKAYVTVSSLFTPSVKAKCLVTVKPIKVTSVKVVPVSMTCKVGAKMPIAYSVLPLNATNPELVWKSTSPGIVSVDENGVFEAKAIGEAVITAISSDGSKLKASCTIKVTA